MSQPPESRIEKVRALIVRYEEMREQLTRSAINEDSDTAHEFYLDMRRYVDRFIELLKTELKELERKETLQTWFEEFGALKRL